jgi:hypothetical protein
MVNSSGARATDGAERGTHQVAASNENDANRGGAAPHFEPGHVIRPVTAQQRHQRHQRNEGEVLEQQHRKTVAAGIAVQQVPLGQHRQNDRGGGEREANAKHRCTCPCRTQKVRQSRQDRRAQRQLRGAKAEGRPAHHP